MKMKHWLLLMPFLFSAVAAPAQSLPRKVSNVEVLDLNGNPAKLPYWGEKNLLIFYIDPDRPKQNNDFTVDMEEHNRVSGDNLVGFGIMNLKDAPLIPNGVAAQHGPQAYGGATVPRCCADQESILRDAWGLGDCNNKFVLLLVSKEGDLVFMRKGRTLGRGYQGVLSRRSGLQITRFCPIHAQDSTSSMRTSAVRISPLCTGQSVRGRG